MHLRTTFTGKVHIMKSNITQKWTIRVNMIDVCKLRKPVPFSGHKK